ncbi:MAG: GNAT family N-acetyltransferase [Anaerolineales bacterium]|nr:GNAT family N-acetyltransferase [Anaerolineales bacterium]
MNVSLQEQLKVSLPEGFTVRGAKLEDVEPALVLFNRWSRSVIHEDEITDADAIRTEWKSPGFDPMEDIRLVFAPNGEMVGYIEVWTTANPPVHPWTWGRVHPDYENKGIGTWLLTWAEERAKRVITNLPADLRFAPRVGIYQQADTSQKLFVGMGFQRIRSSYTMRINMETPPPAPQWPNGITLRTFNPETDMVSVYRVVDEAFSDHFGHIDTPFEEGLERFKHFSTGDENFDPTLWFLAMDGDEIAGISLCRKNAFDNPNVGWVNTLGVLRPWRKQGLGLALLRHSFGELYRRGQRMVGLGVDAENLTGALRLYESAGMHVHLAFDLFEKELRPGKEISVQSL